MNKESLAKWLEREVGLENFREGKERLENSFSPLIKKASEYGIKIIIIAGTNGKGQVSSLITRNLFLNQKKVALWTSPHIKSVSERFWKNNQFPSEESLLQLAKKHKDHAKELSYYEFLFFLFCHWAIDRELDFLVLEVGLGGRLDTVNLFHADFGAIVSISRDHTEFLGNKLKDILREKYGISRPGKPLYCSIIQDYLRESLNNFCKSDRVPLVDLVAEDEHFKDRNYIFRNELLAQRITFDALGNSQALWEGKMIDSHRLSRGGEVTSKLGRFILYGSHNTDGIGQLVNLLLEQRSSKKNKSFDCFLLAFSKRSDEEIRQCLKIFMSSPCLYKSLVFVNFEHFKAASWEKVKLIAKEEAKTFGLLDNILFLDSLDELQTWLNQNDSQSQYLVSGSNYFIGHFLHFFNF